MSLVQDLEAFGHRDAVRRQVAALGGLADERRVVTQCLQEAPHAVLAITRAKQHRRYLVGAELVVQVAIDQRFFRRDILDQLLEQGVVELRQGFEHLASCLGFARQDLGRHLDQVGGAARVVAIGALAHEIDIADRLLAAVAGRSADRYLAQHQLARRNRLQRRQRVAHAAFGRVDLVDEEEMRDAVVLDVFHERRERDHALGRRLAHDDGGVAHGEGCEESCWNSIEPGTSRKVHWSPR